MKSSSIRFIPPLLLAVLFLNACDSTDTELAESLTEVARPAKIVPVTASGINVLRRFPGTLEASNKADLAFRVGGQLAELPAQAGIRVKQGDVLAQLDDTDYQNSLKERQARFELAKIQYDQATKLLRQKLTSQLQYDQAAAELKSARAALDQARDNLEYTRLLAPFDGIVARVDIKNFQAVQAKAPIIRLQNIEQLDIRFSVPESLVSQLKQEDDPEVLKAICGSIYFSAHPGKVFRACHKEHESVPDALTRNYSTVFTLDRITEFVTLPGMSVTMELDFSAFLPDDAIKSLLIPVEAVFEQEGQKWVWRVDNDFRARKVVIEVGAFKTDKIEVTQGLKLKDRVVAAGVSYVREGMLLKPLIKERGL